jgi:hypothetical protein
MIVAGIGLALGGLALTAFIAIWLPTRQATAVDPALVLRGD